MSFINILSEKIVLPGSDFVSGQNISNYLSFLLESQWFDQATLDNYQSDRLTSLVKHTYDNVPYYKELLDNLLQMSNMIKRNMLMNFESLGYTP